MKHRHHHTPGPWYYNRDEGGINSYTINALMLDRAFDFEDIAEIHISEDANLTQEEAERIADANARLIATAPELLESLEMAITALNRVPSFDTGIPCRETGRLLSSYQLLPKLEQAVRKARGKANPLPHKQRDG